jgi:hypothetical protein
MNIDKISIETQKEICNLINDSVKEMFNKIVDLIDDLEKKGLDNEGSFSIGLTSFAMLSEHVFIEFSPFFKYGDYNDFMKKTQECLEFINMEKK